MRNNRRMRPPLHIRKLHGFGDKVACYQIRDAAERTINLYCEEAALRREVAKLFSPEEAEALAKRIARMFTDEAMGQRQEPR